MDGFKKRVSALVKNYNVNTTYILYNRLNRSCICCLQWQHVVAAGNYFFKSTMISFIFLNDWLERLTNHTFHIVLNILQCQGFGFTIRKSFIKTKKIASALLWLVCSSAPYIHISTHVKYHLTRQTIWSVHMYSSLCLSLRQFSTISSECATMATKNDMKYCWGPFQHLEWKIMVQLRLVLGLNWVKGGLLSQTNTTFSMCARKQSPRIRCPLTFHLVLTAWQGRTAHSGTFTR